MSRRVCQCLVASFMVATLAGCGGGWFAQQRDPWRHDAEVACLKSGQVKITAAVSQLPPISGPGVCGADFPLKVAALGESSVLGYADDVRPPGTIPSYAPRPATPPGGYPQPNYGQPYPPPADPAPAYPSQGEGYPASRAAAPGAPLSLKPPGVDADEDDETGPAEPGYGRPYGSQPGVSRGAPLAPPAASPPPYATRDPYGASPAPRAQGSPPPYETGRGPYGQPGGPYGGYGAQPPAMRPLPPLGPPDQASASGTASVVPAATLACPMVSALDQWIMASVQPAALRWFGQPVTEIKQISAYSCRGMNGNPHAHISEHAFGNALDVAAFTLADGRKVTVKDGWRGLPEERGFLRDVHAAACEQFSTVLGPGS